MTNRNRARRGASLASASLLALATAAFAVEARAQAAAPLQTAQAGPSDQEVEQVVVTGSRLQTGFTTPTPVTVLSGATLETLNLNNVGAAISQLPSFRASNTPTTNGFGSFNVGAQIVNLYGLGVNRSLVLLDGRRLPPVTRENTVDLNQIPSELIERTDVVTGGASAAYGSDAVAGAVNIILNKRLNGFKGQADYGIAEAGDGSDWHASLGYGHDFQGGRGHFIVGGEFEKQNVIGNCFHRDWCQPTGIVTNAGADSVAGLPAFVRADSNAGFPTNQNGTISLINNATPATAALRNLFGTGAVTFTNTGTPVAFHLGAPGSGNTAAGGDFTASQLFTQILVPVERHALYGHVDYNLTDDLKGFVEGSYAHVKGVTNQTVYFGSAISIYADNPYIPAALRQVVGSAPATASGTRPAASAFNLGWLGPKQGKSSSEADSYRVATGINGKLGDRITFDAYYQYGHTSRDQSVENNLVTGAGRVINQPGSGGISNPGSLAYFQWATDVVASPGGAGLPAAGTPICRALISPNPALRAAAAGCAPYNPFGVSSASQASLDYVYHTLLEHIDIDQHALAANLQARLFDLPAGPVSAAAGVEYRHDHDVLTHDQLSNLFAYFQNFGADYRAHDDVTEGYAEAQVPLLKDMAFFKALTVDGAVRHAHYSVAGFGGYAQTNASNSFNSTTWKVGVVWDTSDWLRVRFTRSQDFRAPNLYDLFQASASNFTAVTNRAVPGSQSVFPAILAGGNPALQPERAKTTTIGAVFAPHWGFTEGFHVSVDYFNIRVNGYIGTGGAQVILDQCTLNGNQNLCGLIKFGPGNTIGEIDNTNLNLQWLWTQGYNVEADYRLVLDKLAPGLPGAVNFRFLGTNTIRSSTNLFGVITNQAGADGAGGIPRWILNMYATYTGGPASVTLQGRYITPGIFDPTRVGPDQAGYSVTSPISINNNHVDGAFYLNLNASYNIIDQGNRRLQIFGSVNNLFNHDPPVDPQLAYSTNPIYFDQIGRYYRVGVRFNY